MYGMTRCPVFILFIVQSSLTYSQDTLLDSTEDNLYFPDDTFDETVDNDKRSNHFLRFGRKYHYLNKFDDFDDYSMPTRATKREKNDHFARFGRNEEFLRFGRNYEDPSNNKDMFDRFGLSFPDELHKYRGKREANEEGHSKDDTYMRFGKNANFVRFGRNPPIISTTPHVHNNIRSILHKLKNNYHNIRLIQLLNELLRSQKEKDVV